MRSCSPMTSSRNCSASRTRINFVVPAMLLSRRRKSLSPRHGPGLAKTLIAGAIDQFARPKRRIKFCKGLHLGGGGSLREMDRAQLLRVFEPGGGKQFGQRVQGGVMII